MTLNRLVCLPTAVVEVCAWPAPAGQAALETAAEGCQQLSQGHAPDLRTLLIAHTVAAAPAAAVIVGSARQLAGRTAVGGVHQPAAGPAAAGLQPPGPATAVPKCLVSVLSGQSRRMKHGEPSAPWHMSGVHTCMHIHGHSRQLFAEHTAVGGVHQPAAGPVEAGLQPPARATAFIDVLSQCCLMCSQATLVH